MPGSGTSTRQPSSLVCTLNAGEVLTAVRVGRSLQNRLRAIDFALEMKMSSYCANGYYRTSSKAPEGQPPEPLV